MIHYIITKVETCPTCAGLGTVSPDVYDGFIAASACIALDAEAEPAADRPDREDETCPACLGATVRHSSVRLDEALRSLGFAVAPQSPGSSSAPPFLARSNG